MPLGAGHVTNTTANTFIPELWSDEVIAAYKKNLVAANLFKKMNFVGKKGDAIHIPSPTRGNASLKTAQNQVNLIAATEGEVVVLIDKGGRGLLFYSHRGHSDFTHSNHMISMG